MPARTHFLDDVLAGIVCNPQRVGRFGAGLVEPIGRQVQGSCIERQQRSAQGFHCVLIGQDGVTETRQVVRPAITFAKKLSGIVSLLKAEEIDTARTYPCAQGNCDTAR